MRSLPGLVITLIVAVVAWFAFGHRIVDSIDQANERSGGGGPQAQRVVSAGQFGPIAGELRRAAGSEIRLVSVTLRPDSVEFEVLRHGRARGYRWRRGQSGLRTFEVGGSGRAGQPDNVPFRLSLLDPRAPGRIARAISTAEHGDFHLSIGDIQRADSGKVVWVMRGTIGERGVAYYALPDGSRVRPYNPASPELSRGAALGQCIQAAHLDPQRVQRCVARYGR